MTPDNSNASIIAEQLLKVLDRQNWKTTIEIANEIDITYSKLVPLLVFGRDKVFAYDAPNKWKLCKKNIDHQITDFLEDVSDGKANDKLAYELFFGKNLERFKQKQRRDEEREAGQANIIPKEVDYSTEENSSNVKLRKDGFPYGRKRKYDGPDGEYWTDPNYKKEKDNER